MEIRVLKEKSWLIINHDTGSRRYVTHKEAFAFLKKHPTYTYEWLGGVCLIIIKSKKT